MSIYYLKYEVRLADRCKMRDIIMAEYPVSASREERRVVAFAHRACLKIPGGPIVFPASNMNGMKIGRLHGCS